VGTASLVFGLICIGVGLYFFFIVDPEMEAPLELLIIAKLIFLIPLVVIGGLFLRKYDKDRKKEKNS